MAKADQSHLMSDPTLISPAFTSALQAIRNGADPNASVKELSSLELGKNSLEGYGSPLFIALKCFELSVAKELLDRGATVECRHDQPTNLIALVARQFPLRWRILHDIQSRIVNDPESGHDERLDDTLIQEFEDALSMLQDHGARCDPQTIDFLLHHPPIDLPSLPVKEIDPLLAMLQSPHLGHLPSKVIIRVIDALLDRGADPDPTRAANHIAHPTNPNAPWQGILIEHLAKAQATYDRDALLTEVGNAGTLRCIPRKM